MKTRLCTSAASPRLSGLWICAWTALQAAPAAAPKADPGAQSSQPGTEKPAAPDSQASAQPTLLIEGARLHRPGLGVTASPETLWIQGRRIAEPSASPEQRADLQRVDATGLYLIPGLIDSYCYFDAGQAALYTAAGVLTLFDHGGDPGRVLDARAHAASPSSPMPEIRSAIAVLDGDPPAAPLSAVVRSAHDVEHQVRLLRESEADFLAFQAGIGVEPWRRLLELAAHPEPLPAEPDKEPVVLPPLLVFGPLPRAATLDDVLQHKGHGLVFLDAFLPAGKHWDELELADFDRSPLQERIAKAGAARQAIVPALRALARLLEDPARQAFTLDHLDPRWSALWSSELAGRKVTITSAERQRLERALSVQRELVRRLDAAGARLVPGSGAPHAWLAPGRGLIDELQEWERAGIAPARALELATSAAAKVWQRSDLGTLSAGSLASVVALRKDPSLSSAALAEVEFVIVRGKLLTRADLEQRLEQLREENTRQRAALGAPLSIPAPEQPEGTVLISGYSETQSSVGRLAGERWSVVREPSGALAFCGRRYRPSAGPAMGELTVHVMQRIVDGQFERFEVRAISGGHELRSRGLQVGGSWRVERRGDGAFIDTKATKEAIVALDVDSVTTAMLLAHTQKAGRFFVLRMHEGLESEVGRWDLALEEDGDHWLRTPSGLRAARFDASGALETEWVQLGSGNLVTQTKTKDQAQAGGLPLPPEKLALLTQAQSAAPAPQSSAPPPVPAPVPAPTDGSEPRER